MKRWLDQYQDLMRKTRVLSAAGASFAVAAATLDIFRLFWALSVAEISLFDDRDLAWNTGKVVFLLSIVATAFIIRIIVLFSASGTAYYKFFGSWFVAMTIAIGYVWLTDTSTPPPAADCTPSEGKICFGIYDMTNSFEWVRLIAVVYLPVSAFRSLATGVIAAMKYQYK